MIEINKNKKTIPETEKLRHYKSAPYWAATLIIIGGIGIATIWVELGSFWKGYVLDMTGPAWNYILFRGLFTAKTDNIWTRFFSPARTLFIFLITCTGIELAQYFNLYEAVYDPWDFLAYISLLLPLSIIDLYQTKKRTTNLK